MTNAAGSEHIAVVVAFPLSLLAASMATGGDPAAALQDEATCSICLDYFQDPLMIMDCGHNFCRACITQYSQGPHFSLSGCPECRKPFPRENLRANRHLRNMAALIQQFRSQRLSEAEGAQKVCGKHREVLKLFCREDRAVICLVCKESGAHKAHTALPIDEAVQEYQDQIQSHLTLLKKERDEVLLTKISCEKVIETVMRNIVRVREQKEHMFPKGEARTLLALLRETEEKAVQMVEERARDALEHSSHLIELIGEMEGRCLQPAFEFLQDIGAFLSKCEREMARKPKAELGMTAASILQKLWLVQYKVDLLSGGNLPRDFSKPRSADTTLLPKQQPASQHGVSPVYLSAYQRGHLIPAATIKPLTFDAKTAHLRLAVSRSGKSVRWGRDIQQDLLPDARRFNCSCCLLSSQGFTSGHHVWVVEVVKEGPWAIGVALESVRRKGSVNMTPREGIWAMAFKNRKYLVSPAVPLPLSVSPRLIQVSLHYEYGQVMFMDFHSKTVLCRFASASFLGQKVHAFFHVGGPSAYLRLCCKGYLARLRFL